MSDLRLYTVLFTAVQFIIGHKVHTEIKTHSVIAVDGNQAINSMMPQVEEEFPANQGWQVEAEAYAVNDRVIELLVESWGWVRKEGV
jgi:hypothetical protein